VSVAGGSDRLKTWSFVRAGSDLARGEFWDLENRTWSDLQAKSLTTNEWMANFDTVAPSAGESFADLQVRILKRNRKHWSDQSMRRLDSTATPSGLNPGAPSETHYLIVTHAGVIRVSHLRIFDLPFERPLEFTVPYGAAPLLPTRKPLETSGYGFQRENSFPGVRTVNSFLHLVLGGSRSGKSRHAEAWPPLRACRSVSLLPTPPR